MQVWKWLGIGAGLLIALPATAQTGFAFPPEAPSRAAAPPSHSAARVTEPGVHDVAQRQQSGQRIEPVAEQALLPPPLSVGNEVSRWYGGYTLMTDGIALASAIAGGFTEPDGEALFYLAAGGYLLGAPIVHLAHGNPGRAAGSLALRAGLPLALLAAGNAFEDCQGQDFCGYRGALIGIPVGVVTAIALDAAVLARDTVQAPPRLVPTAALGPHSAAVGLGGTF